MPSSEQFELFASDKPELTPPVQSSAPAPVSSPNKNKGTAELAPEVTHLNRDPMAIRTEGTEQLTDYLKDFSSSFYVVHFPRRLLSVFAFPLTQQQSWKATHQSENYTLETGICEGCPERSPEVMTIRDFGYFMALYSLVKNTQHQLITVIYLRLLLDGIAGLKFLFQGELNHTFAIVKAHLNFYQALPRLIKLRRQTIKTSKPENLHPSIVWSYFVLKIKHYSKLHK